MTTRVITTILCLSVLQGHTKTTDSDSFTVIKDGVPYLCERQIPPDPMGYILCRDLATKGPFTRDESIMLCQYSYTESPAECAIKAYNGPFLKSQAILICQYARNTGPAECAIKAYNSYFSKDEAIELCKTIGTERNADCAIKAYNLGYSKQEAIKFCNSYGNRSLIEMKP